MFLCLCFYIAKGMRKCIEFKISLSNFRTGRFSLTPTQGVENQLVGK